MRGSAVRPKTCASTADLRRVSAWRIGQNFPIIAVNVLDVECVGAVLVHWSGDFFDVVGLPHLGHKRVRAIHILLCFYIKPDVAKKPSLNGFLSLHGDHGGF